MAPVLEEVMEKDEELPVATLCARLEKRGKEGKKKGARG